MKVFLDFGHGGSDSGATYKGLIEKNMNLITGLSCRDELLKYNVEVKCSRISDIAVSLSDRCRMTNAWNSDYFVSIHYNSAKADRGEVIHSIYRGEGLELANNIAAEMKLLGQDIIKVYEKKGTDNKDYYYVIKNTNCTSVIVEGGFIDNEIDNKLFDTVEEQKAMGIAIAHGILKQLGIAIKVENPTPNQGYIITNYLPQGEYGIEIVGMKNHYFPGVDRVYLKANDKGVWCETQWLSYDKCLELKTKLENDKIFYEIKSK